LEIQKELEELEEVSKPGTESFFQKIASKISKIEISEEELSATIKKKIGEMGEVAMKDFGKIMGAVMAEVKGRAGGDMVKRIIEEEMKSLNM